MKKIILLIIVCSVQIVTAQVIQGSNNVKGGGINGDIMFGAKVGFGFSTSVLRDNGNITNRPSVFIGGLAEIPAFFDKFYLQPEVMIQLANADIDGENLVRWYLQIPMMSKYHLSDAFAVEVGPQVGILISDNWDQNISIVEIRKVGVSLNIGGGYRLDKNFYFNLRLGSGLTRVSNTGSFNLQIGANYFF